MTKYDLFYLGLVILIGMYFYQTGIMRMLKPFLGVLVSKQVNGIISTVLLDGGIGIWIQNAINEILAKLLMYENVQLSVEISNTLVKAIIFILTYFLVKVFLNTIYSLSKPKVSLLRKANRFLGLAASILVSIWLTKLVTMFFYGMSQLQFEFARKFMDIINNSLVLKFISCLEIGNII